MAPFQPSFLNVLKNFLQFSHLETSLIFSGQALGDLVPFSVNFLLESDPQLWIIVKTACAVNFIILVLTVLILVWAYRAVPRIQKTAHGGSAETVGTSMEEDSQLVNTHESLGNATQPI